MYGAHCIGKVDMVVRDKLAVLACRHYTIEKKECPPPAVGTFDLLPPPILFAYYMSPETEHNIFDGLPPFILWSRRK